jgi:predicted phosphodiesterase
MRIAVISDIHGNLRALEEVLFDISERSVDLTVNLGDCVTSPLWPRATLELLDTLALPTVRGNHDRWVDHEPDAASDTESVLYTREALSAAQRRQLFDLPTSLEVADGVLAVHGSPRSDVEYLLETKVNGQLARLTADVVAERLGDVSAELILCGHSHTQHLACDRRGRLVLNPGSVGCPRYADNADRLTNEAGSPHARYAVATKRGSSWSVDLIAVAYPWEIVVAKARKNGRDDWADGFLGH